MSVPTFSSPRARTDPTLHRLPSNRSSEGETHGFLEYFPLFPKLFKSIEKQSIRNTLENETFLSSAIFGSLGPSYDMRRWGVGYDCFINSTKFYGRPALEGS